MGLSWSANCRDELRPSGKKCVLVVENVDKCFTDFQNTINKQYIQFPGRHTFNLGKKNTPGRVKNISMEFLLCLLLYCPFSFFISLTLHFLSHPLVKIPNTHSHVHHLKTWLLPYRKYKSR